jgi:hypothetical protein
VSWAEVARQQLGCMGLGEHLRERKLFRDSTCVCRKRVLTDAEKLAGWKSLNVQRPTSDVPRIFPVKRTKGARGMPRHGQAMKGVVSCEKHREAARRL